MHVRLLDNSNRVLQGTMVLNASHRELLENTESFGGKKIHPSTDVPHHGHFNHSLHPTPECEKTRPINT